MEKNFNREAFVVNFDKALARLKRAEKITKEVLRDMSRDVLEATHATGDIGFVNRLVVVLTPINRKVAVKFFIAFTGFSLDDKTGLFTKKSKKRYDDALEASVEFLADPHQNIWTWADRNIEIEAKEFTVDKVADVVKRAIKKNIDQHEIIKAVLSAGVTMDTLIEVMGAIIPEGEKESVLNHVSAALGYDVV